MRVRQPGEESIFHAARGIADRGSRDAYLDEVCNGDDALRVRVGRLLHALDQEPSFLEEPSRDATVALPSFLEGPGTVIGPYKLLEQIGEGGMGQVFMAEQTAPVHRRVALKIIKPGMNSRQVIARFEAERQALAMMDHSNIARVLDVGATATGRPYFVMELVRGIPITEYCDRDYLTVPARLELFVLVCRAVQHAHQKGIIHRDIKPSNVLITLHDGVPVPKIIDFGIAKATGQSLTDKTLFTGFMQLIGTPLYMSPEQAEMSGLDIDTRSDIYSLGVLLYELLTGTTPFDPDTFHTAGLDEMRRIIREEEPPKPSTRLSALVDTLTTVSANRGADPRRLNRVVRGELDWIAMKALEKDRRRRYETANDFAADVMKYLTDRPVEACPPSGWYRLSKAARRNRVALVTSAMVTGALLIGLAASVAMAVRAVSAERETTAALTRARDHLAEADRQRASARKAVDEMYTQVAEKWLAQEGGLTLLQREFLEKAQAFYKEFARGPADDPAARAEAAKASARVGEVRAALGLHEEAAAAFQQSVERFEALAGESPAEPEYRRGLAAGLQGVASQRRRLGRLPDAERSLRQAVAIQAALAAEHPERDTYRRDLASGYTLLGSLCWDNGRQEEAEKVYRASRDLLQRLVAEAPASREDRGNLASAERQVGDALARSGRLWQRFRADAERAYGRSLALLETLTAEAPAEPAYRRSLSATLINLGRFQENLYRYAEAQQSYQRAQEILEKLASDHPDRPAYREDIVTALSASSRAFSRAGQRDDAERAARGTLTTAERLAVDFPAVPNYRFLLASSLRLLGNNAVHGRPRDAEESFRRAIEVLEKLMADHPETTQYRGTLANACFELAELYATAKDGTFRDSQRALELARRSVALTPRGVVAWKVLASAEYRAGNWDAAIAAVTKAMEISGSAYEYQYLLLTLAHAQKGNAAEASVWFNRAHSRLASDPANNKRAAGEIQQRWVEAAIYTLYAEAATLLGRPAKLTFIEDPAPLPDGFLPRLTVRAPRVAVAPVADGEVKSGEYGPSVTAEFADDDNPGRLWTGSRDRAKAPDDLSYRVSAAHTATTLFVAVEVRDQFLDDDQTEGNGIYLNDCVELVINGDRVANDLTPSNLAGSREGFQILCDAHGSRRTGARDFTNEDWRVGTRVVPGGYIVEFEVPLRLIDTRDGPGEAPAKTGDLLLMNVAVYDNDERVAAQDNVGLLWSDDPRYRSFQGGEVTWAVGLDLAP
jgi:eukaryotic-like serine/threonine-protein kinase